MKFITGLTFRIVIMIVNKLVMYDNV